MKSAVLFKAVAGTALLVSAGAGFALAAAAPSSPVTVVQQYVAAQNAHDYQKMASLLADSIVVGSLFSSRAERLNFQWMPRAKLLESAQRVATQFPRMRFEIISVIAENHMVVTKELFTGGSKPGSDIGMTIYRATNGTIDYMVVIPPE